MHADGWTQPEGAVQLITSAYFYTSDTRFDTSGDTHSQPRYTKEELSPYLEYGLTDSTTLGGQLRLDHAGNQQGSSTGLADSEFFLRQRLWHGNNAVFSLQPFFTLPGSRNEIPALGSSAGSAGMSAQGGTSFSLFGRTHYIEADLGYAHRFGRADDQLLASATAGLYLGHGWTLMPQLFQTVSVPQPGANAAFTESPRDDYNLTTLEFSVLYAFDRENAVQLGAFHDVAGKNAGQGTGAILAYWRNF